MLHRFNFIFSVLYTSLNICAYTWMKKASFLRHVSSLKQHLFLFLRKFAFIKNLFARTDMAICLIRIYSLWISLSLIHFASVFVTHFEIFIVHTIVRNYLLKNHCLLNLGFAFLFSALLYCIFYYLNFFMFLKF